MPNAAEAANLDGDAMSTATPVSASTAAPSTLLIVAGVVAIVGAALMTHRVRAANSSPASRARRSTLWYRSAGAAFAGLFGAQLVTIGVWPGKAAGLWLTYAFLAVPAALGAVGAGVAFVDRRRQRTLRRELGLTTLRRRVHWGWAAVAGFSLAMATGILAFLLMWQAGYRLDSSGRAPDPVIVGFIVWVMIATVVAGLSQAGRRGVRDRRIEDSDLPIVGLERVDDNRPPPWLPTPVGQWWSQVCGGLDAPVKAGREWAVILTAALAGVFTLGVVAIMVAPLASRPGIPDSLRGMLAGMTGVVTLVVAVVLLSEIATTGLRTAIRSLRHAHKQRGAAGET